MFTLPKLWILCLLLGLYAHAQKIAFRNYSVQSGMPSSEVYKVYQDAKGYMWFCTDAGVCRYDGYTYKTYTNENGLFDNSVFGLYEDWKGRMWFFDMSKNLSYYEPGHDSILAISCHDSLAKTLQNTSIMSLHVTRGDTVYIGVNTGTSFYRICPAGNFGKLERVPLPLAGWQFYRFKDGSVVCGTTTTRHADQMQLNEYYGGKLSRSQALPDAVVQPPIRYRCYAAAKKGY